MSARSRKLPALHFYPGDWKKDLGVQSLDFFDRHVWFEMLLLMHESELRGYLVINGQPMNEETISRLIGLPEQIFSKSLANIKARGVCSVAEDGAIFNRKMVAADELSSKRAIAGKAGADARLLKQNGSKGEANIQANAEDVIEDEDEDLNLKRTVEPPPAQPVLPSKANAPAKFTLQLPPDFNTPEVIQGFKLWARKSEKNGRPLDQIGAEAILGRFVGRPKALARALMYSASLSRCFNIIEDPNCTEQIKNPSKQPTTQGGRALIKNLGLEKLTG